MIIMDCDEDGVKEKLLRWNEALNMVGKEWDYPVSVSTGYAVGEGKDIAEIIHKADQLMYENKREWHRNNFFEVK